VDRTSVGVRARRPVPASDSSSSPPAPETAIQLPSLGSTDEPRWCEVCRELSQTYFDDWRRA